jgi:bacterioferritin-associated ferredoxin
MRVCHCRNVSEQQVREAIRRGCADVEALARTLGLGTGCGGCRSYADALIAYWREVEPASQDAA